MFGRIEARLQDLEIALPDAPAPAANYVPFVRCGDQLFVSGQISQDSDGLLTGKVGAEITAQEAKDRARLCGLALLAQARAACDGDLDKIKRVVKLVGFVNAAPGFSDHPEVINGCSDLMVEIFGDAGRHARSAVGTSSLPRNVSVEIEAVFELA